MKLAGRGADELEFNSIFVARLDLVDRLEQDAARNADASWRFGDPVERRLHVIGRQFRAVVKLHALAQKERVGRAVLGDSPTMCQVRNDRLAAVAWIMPDQIVEHATLGTDIAHRSRLLEVEMWRAIQYADAQHAASLRVRFRRRKLELRTVEFGRDDGQRLSWPQPARCGHSCCATLNKSPAAPTPVNGVCFVHFFLLPPCIDTCVIRIWPTRTYPAARRRMHRSSRSVAVP